METNLFQAAKIRLLLDQPFFGTLALHLTEKTMPNNRLPDGRLLDTVAVDGKNLYVNPEFLSSLKKDEMQGLLAHEIMHVCLGHIYPWRRKHREPIRWNKANDYVINLLLTEAGLKLPKNGLLDKAYDNMSSEQVYSKLPEENDKKNEKGGGGGDLPWADIIEDTSCTESEGKQLEREWKELLVQAATAAKMRGRLPSGINRLIDDIVNPTIPWASILANFLNEVLYDDYDLLRSDRRFIQQGIYLPDLYSEGCSVVIAVDTSGSIGSAEIQLFVSECVGILSSRNVKSVRIMSFDTKVHLDVKLQPWDDLPENYPGGGGSDVRPVFKRLHSEGASEKPSCLIVLTDMYISFPEAAPDYPVVWATQTDINHIDPPFGTVIQFNPDDGSYEINRGGGSDCQDDGDGYNPYTDDSEEEYANYA